MFFFVFLVPLIILTIARRGKGSGEPGCDIRTRRSILYRTDAGKTKSIFHSNLALRAPYEYLFVIKSYCSLSTYYLI
jgi:hypothetical protein